MFGLNFVDRAFAAFGEVFCVDGGGSVADFAVVVDVFVVDLEKHCYSPSSLRTCWSVRYMYPMYQAW